MAQSMGCFSCVDRPAPRKPRPGGWGGFTKLQKDYSRKDILHIAKLTPCGIKQRRSLIVDVSVEIDGSFIAKLCLSRRCVCLVSQLMAPVPIIINERLSEGPDPNDLQLMRYVRCPDVGVECLGYGGEVMLKAKGSGGSENAVTFCSAISIRKLSLTADFERSW
jgi:hypothetical protein